MDLCATPENINIIISYFISDFYCIPFPAACITPVVRTENPVITVKYLFNGSDNPGQLVILFDSFLIQYFYQFFFRKISNMSEILSSVLIQEYLGGNCLDAVFLSIGSTCFCPYIMKHYIYLSWIFLSY